MSVQPSQRVAIVGAGNVGASIAYSLVNQEIAREILIIDIAEELARAQVLDLQDASNFTRGVHVSYATYADLEDGDIVVVTAGAAQKEGQSRVDLLKINAGIVHGIVAAIRETGKKVYIIMVTNPVDVLTYIAVKESAMPEGMVFGSGTYLDTARLRKILARRLDINSQNLHAHIIGEHGDTSLPVLSSASVAGVPLSGFVETNEAFYQEVAEEVRQGAYKIIEGKKATYYGIGSAISVMIRAIVRNEKRIIPLSVHANGEYGLNDVCIGLPAKLGINGVQIVKEIQLNDYEKGLLNKSAEFIKENIRELN